ncbi:hypothetical protein FE257_006613 [Aspergillus nanangensis]|uniref:Uncharacterized protein n=1 Tax=Aspergillus nanangensis TaxID=2582783 RepID=A0AAD4CZK5_ASPNN|nr:hypothetical protein FE257_006613 [Aspergillus nanangensis]
MTNSCDQELPETLDIDEKLLETVNIRRTLCDAKGALARSILAQQTVKNVQLPDNSSSSNLSQLSPPAPTIIDLDAIDPIQLLQKHGGTETGPNNQQTLDAADDPDDPTTWPERISRAEDDDDSKFVDAEFRFNSIFMPTMADRVKLEQARRQEEARKKRVAGRNALKEQGEEDSDDDQPEQPKNELFCVDEPEIKEMGPQEQASEEKKRQKPNRKPQNKLSAEERRKSMKLGLDVALGRAGLKPRGRTGKRKRANANSGPNKRSKKEDKQPEVSLESLLYTDVTGEGHASAIAAEKPDICGKNKEKALTQLLASIPSADQEDARSDKKKLIDASKQFTKSARRDEQGHWIVNGLLTRLFDYQLLGAAFMRDRENSGFPPFGGLLCDVMGFGKTIQALANIIDGMPSDAEDPVKTTLIVVPSHLITHWKTQIERHCKKGVVGRIAEYHAKSRILSITSSDAADILQTMGVIITTYEEVRKSYPTSKAPKDLTTEAQIVEWYNEIYQKEIGPLHQIKFLRIILDEGHMIKNHFSSVSVAVRALTAKYKWILTGTPVLNYIEEFYPQFDFLGVPNIKGYDDFVKNYCQCGPVEDISQEESSSATASQDATKKPSKEKKKTLTKKKTRTGMVAAVTTKASRGKKDEEGDNDDDDDEKDWISACGSQMPSAKLAKITEIISTWITEEPTVKIVVFTQFMAFVRILVGMCKSQGWKSASLHGKMSVGAREKSMNTFRTSGDVRVMIASLKAGGTGLDMTMANKCILVDLWWNEGIQQQAFCRLFRIGQEKAVEVIKLIAKETIDDYMRRLQTEKSEEITNTMGEAVLAERETFPDLLQMFGEVIEHENGGFIVQPRKRSRKGMV